MTGLLGLAAVPLAVAFTVLGLRAPLHVLLPAYAAFVPFGSLLSLPGGVLYRFSSVSSLLGLALSAALVWRILRGAPAARRLTGSVAVWLLLLGVATATAIWTVSPDDSLGSVAVLASLVLLYVLVAVTPVDRRAVRLTETGLLVGGLLATLYGAVQAVTGTLPSSDMGGERFGRDLLGANHTAAALILPIVVALGRAAAAGSSVRSRVLHGAAVLFLLLGVALTGSRGGLLGAGVAFLVVAAYGRRPAFFAGFGALVALAAVAVIVLQPGGVGERATREGDSGRLDIWQVAAVACQEHCLTGAGWGTFPVVYRETQARVAGANVLLRGTSFEPHNVWILVGVEAGIAGLALLVVGMVLAIAEALRIPPGVRGPPLGALAGIFTTAFFLSNFEFKYFWMALIYVTISRHATEDDDADRAAVGSAPATA